MSSTRFVLSSARCSLTSEICFLCQRRQFTQAVRRNGIPKPVLLFKSRTSAHTLGIGRWNHTTARYDAKRMRIDVDKRNRLGFYTLSNQQGILKIDPHKADSIIADFLAQKARLDQGSNVQRLATKYKISFEQLASLAIVTYKIPDVSDPAKKAMLPLSEHSTTSGLLLRGCAQAEEPLAIVQILSAVYQSSLQSNSVLAELARQFPQHEITKYRQTLEKLCLKAKTLELGPDLLTLRGLFLEREGKKQKAKESYEESILRSHLKYTPGSKHPMQVPLTPPWIALGYLFKSSQDPSEQAQAKKAFEQGAFEADDPLSYWELSAFEPRTSPRWLQCTSKAAASGHREAMVNLAKFYEEVNSKISPILGSKNMRKALNWLRGWRPGSAAALAREWLHAAANQGHKPSMLQLASYAEAAGNVERAKEQLRKIIEPPSLTNGPEEWPQLIQLARQRLGNIQAKA